MVKFKWFVMKSSNLIKSKDEMLIDFSHEEEVAYWSAMLNTSPVKIKSAARACCSNVVSTLSMYLKNNKSIHRRMV